MSYDDNSGPLGDGYSRVRRSGPDNQSAVNTGSGVEGFFRTLVTATKAMQYR